MENYKIERIDVGKVQRKNFFSFYSKIYKPNDFLQTDNI